jgi:hypothetical protein
LNGRSVHCSNKGSVHVVVAKGAPGKMCVDKVAVALPVQAEQEAQLMPVTYRGTHAGEFAGIPATCGRIEYAATAMDRLENGKVVEIWHTINTHLLIAGDGSPPQKP